MNDMQKHLLKLKLSEYFIKGTIATYGAIFLYAIIFG